MFIDSTALKRNNHLFVGFEDGPVSLQDVDPYFLKVLLEIVCKISLSLCTRHT